MTVGLGAAEGLPVGGPDLEQAARLGSGPAPARFGARYCLWQNWSVPYATRVRRADEVFAALFADLQVVGDPFAVWTMTKNQSIRRMVKAKVFH